MKKLKKMNVIIIITIFVLITIPTSVYGYNYKMYKDDYSKALLQLKEEKYEQSIKLLNNISNTYFGKKNITEINNNIKKAKKYSKNKKTYDDALKLFNDKKYLEANEIFKKISSDDTKRFNLAKKKIEDGKNLYISLNIENAKNEAKAGKYDSALNFLTLALNVDNVNKDVIMLKDEYTKAKNDAELKAKDELKAKQVAEASKKVADASKKQIVSKPLNPTSKNSTSNSSTSNSSEYPKVKCEDNTGIFIYQNAAQEKDWMMNGGTWLFFGHGSIDFGIQPCGFYYTLVKCGPSPEFKYTIEFNYDGEISTCSGTTSNEMRFYSPTKGISDSIVGKAKVTIIYNGKQYSFTQTFRSNSR